MTPRREELIEKLAAIEHERWARWHRYAVNNWSPAMIERWNRQAETPYEALSELEKESDRAEVRIYWPLIEEELNTLKSSLEAKDARIERLQKIVCGVAKTLESERAMARELVDKFSTHKPDCTFYFEEPCDCGFSEAIAKYRAREGKKGEQV